MTNLSLPAVTMSSREIAKLVESRHDDVKRSIERLAERGVIVRPPMADEQTADKLGRPRSESVYRVNKRDSYIVVAQLSPEFTARLVDRWQELEDAAQQPAIDPANLSRLQLIEMAMQAEHERLALAHQVETLEPKAKALDAISASSDTLTFTQSAKILGKKRETLTKWLHSHGWIYRQNGSWVAYDKSIKAGYLAYKEANYTDEKTGQAGVKPYCHITQKGLTKLAVTMQP